MSVASGQTLVSTDLDNMPPWEIPKFQKQTLEPTDLGVDPGPATSCCASLDRQLHFLKPN